MTTRGILLLFCVLLSACTPLCASESSDGNQLLDWCAVAVQHLGDNGLGITDPVDLLRFTRCLTYLEGYVSAAQLCLPSVTAGQVARVVSKFLVDNPERLHEPMGNLTGEALGKAFPCKEQDLSSALEDAGYALRRFEETTAHIDFSEWPKEMQSATSEALRQAHEQAADGRRILAKFDGSGKTVSSVDLLDITLDLGSVEMELSALETGTSEVLCLGTLDMAQMAKAHAFADELIQADQSAAAAQTKVYGALRDRLAGSLR